MFEDTFVFTPIFSDTLLILKKLCEILQHENRSVFTT